MSKSGTLVALLIVASSVLLAVVVELVLAKAPGWTVAETTGVISAVVALVAVVVGPLASYLVAKSQIRASVVSANRQVWINSLRDQLAEFSALLIEVVSLVPQSSISTDEHRRVLRASVQVRSKIILLLNPKEPDHIKLIALTEEANNLAMNGDPADRLSEVRNRFIDQAQTVLKREWERVKRGD